MAAEITAATRLVLICNPNNPTSTSLPLEAVEAFLQRVPRHVCVILDEAYCEFALALGDTYASTELLRRWPNLVLLRTFSKAYGLAGLRVGYGLCGSEDFRAAVDQVRQPFYLNMAAQAGAVEALRHQDEVERRVTHTVAARLELMEGCGRWACGWPSPTPTSSGPICPRTRSKPMWWRVCARAECWCGPAAPWGATAPCGSRSAPTPRTSASWRPWPSSPDGPETPRSGGHHSRAALYVQPGGGNDFVGAWRSVRAYGGPLRDYIRRGGRYLGICMGGYLAGSDPGFNLLAGNCDDYTKTRGAQVKDERNAVITVDWHLPRRRTRRKLFYQDGPYFWLHHGARGRVLARYTNHRIAA